jgi:Phage tail sheath C-terminal domain
MAILSSPGVSVTVTDESFYASAGQGTVPLVVVATAANKLQSGSTTALAQGTLKANANKLYLMTSQRDVLTTFGSPRFYSAGGSQQYDNELNELGLFSLYEYLGIANTAYAIRADVDLGQLAPSSTAPVGQAANGDYWLDLNHTTWGIFKSNGEVNSAYAWTAKTPTVISNKSNLEVIVQGYAPVAIRSSSDPLGFSQAYTLVIGTASGNGVSIPVYQDDSLSNIVNRINSNTAITNRGISASIFAIDGKYSLTASDYGTIYNLRLTLKDIAQMIILEGSSVGLLDFFGLTADPNNVVAPAHGLGNGGDIAVDTVSVDMGSVASKNKIWEKITLSTDAGTTSYWFKAGSTTAGYPGWGWREAAPRVITGSVKNPTFTPGDTCTIKIGTQGPYTITVPAAQAPATTASLAQLVTAINTVLNTSHGGLNAVASIHTVGSSNYLRITNYDGTNTWFNDISTVNFNNLAGGWTDNVWKNAGIYPTQTYYGSVTGTVANPTYTTAHLNTASATPVNIGSGYNVNDILTVTSVTVPAPGTQSALQVTSLTVVNNQPSTPAANNQGSNYSAGDILTFGVVGSNYSQVLKIVVDQVGGGGNITQFHVDPTSPGIYIGTVAPPTTAVAPTSQTNSTGGPTNGNSATFNLQWGVKTVNVSTPGDYTTFPSNPVTTSSGGGTGATFNLVHGYNSADVVSIDPGTGIPTLVVVYPATLTGIVSAINTAFSNGPIVASATTDNKLKIVNTNGTSFTLEDISGTALNNSGIKVGYTFGRQLTYQGYGTSLSVPNGLDQLAVDNIWINTTPADRGANLVVKQYINGVWTPLNIHPNTGTVPMYSSTAYADAGFGANKANGSVFALYNTDGDVPPEANQRLHIWNASTSNWDELMYTASLLAPSGPPVEGTLWYSTALQYDIMVSTGQIWKGYKNMYPATDANGPILDASQPLTQNNGNPLVEGDIWIDTSINNVFTAYRYDSMNNLWRLIDNTDHSSPAGIVFADARATDENGSSLIADMVVSDNVDPDVIDAHLYPMGMLLLNTRYSTNNVKIWVGKKFPQLVPSGRWVTASGNAPDGTPYIGHKAQRQIVVNAVQATLVNNQEARAEQTYFNLLATPGYPEAIDEMVTLNTDKKEIAFIIADTPARLTPDGTSIQNWATNANNATDNGDVGLITANPYVGIYYPWALATNLDGSEVFVPPSMMALRTYAYNDQVAYPWFAPAGFNRGLVTGVNSVGYLASNGTYVPTKLNQGQRDVMYINNINPIAMIPNRGLVVYGQKTLNSVASALDRVNVARLINYLNYQLDNIAKPFLFEPNDKQTRQSVVTTFSGFMGNLVGLRALYDYAVVCDESNNTAVRIDRNELWIDIAIKPEKAIEFIYIPIRILNTGDPLPNGSQNATA